MKLKMDFNIILNLIKKVNPDLEIITDKKNRDIHYVFHEKIIEYNNWVNYTPDSFYSNLTKEPKNLSEILHKDFCQLSLFYPDLEKLHDKIFFAEIKGFELNAEVIKTRHGHFIGFSSGFIELLHSFFTKTEIFREPITRDLIEKYDELIKKDTYSDSNLFLSIVFDFYLNKYSTSIEPNWLDFYHQPYDLCEKICAARKFALAHEIGHLLIDENSFKFNNLRKLGISPLDSSYSRLSRITQSLEGLQNKFGPDKLFTFKEIEEYGIMNIPNFLPHIPFKMMMEDSVDKIAIDILFAEFSSKENLNQEDIYKLTNVAQAPLFFFGMLHFYESFSSNPYPINKKNPFDCHPLPCLRKLKTYKLIVNKLEKIAPALIVKVKIALEKIEMIEFMTYEIAKIQVLNPKKHKQNKYYNSFETHCNNFLKYNKDLIEFKRPKFE